MPRKMAREPGNAVTDTAVTNSPAPSKISIVLNLLCRDQGATLAELVEATCWLPHTTRAALTGLRKKGHALEKGKRDDVTCYYVRSVA